METGLTIHFFSRSFLDQVVSYLGSTRMTLSRRRWFMSNLWCTATAVSTVRPTTSLKFIQPSPMKTTTIGKTVAEVLDLSTTRLKLVWDISLVRLAQLEMVTDVEWLQVSNKSDESCNTNTQRRCFLGDLTEKHGRLSVAGLSSQVSGTKRFFTDVNLPLFGTQSIVGRSIVIIDDNSPKQRGNRLACTPWVDVPFPIKEL